VLTRGDSGRMSQHEDTFESVFRGPRWAVWKRRQPPM
jgi:hypothetical protein